MFLVQTRCTCACILDFGLVLPDTWNIFEETNKHITHDSADFIQKITSFAHCFNTFIANFEQLFLIEGISF